MLSIRTASIEDAKLIAAMIRELAEYERLSHEVVVTENDIARDGFGRKPRFRVLIAEWNGDAAGYALFFDIYSTFQGQAGLFLEDIFVRTEFRAKGIGKALMARVARIARQEGCFCLRWEVLDWNTPAIEFYRRLGADFLDDWRTACLVEDGLRAVAEQSQ